MLIQVTLFVAVIFQNKFMKSGIVLHFGERLMSG